MPRKESINIIVLLSKEPYSRGKYVFSIDVVHKKKADAFIKTRAKHGFELDKCLMNTGRSPVIEIEIAPKEEKYQVRFDVSGALKHVTDFMEGENLLEFTGRKECQKIVTLVRNPNDTGSHAFIAFSQAGKCLHRVTIDDIPCPEGCGGAGAELEESIKKSLAVSEGSVRENVVTAFRNSNTKSLTDESWWVVPYPFSPQKFKEDYDEGDHGMFTNLMETITLGTIQQTKHFLNKKQTISEVEIKEAVTWASDQNDHEILQLLLQNVCRWLSADESDNCVEAFPAYRKGHRWEPLFVVLSKCNYQGDWDSFMGFSVYRRRYDFVSSEAALVMNNELVINNPLSLEDFAAVKSAVGQAGLQKKHSNITVISACPYRSKRGGEVLEKGLCVVINCLLKGFIPFDEEAFPEEISGIPVDVREAYFQLGVRTPPQQRRGPPQLWDKGTSVSDDASNQASANSGSQSSDSVQSLLQSNSSASMSSSGPELQHQKGRSLMQHILTDPEGDMFMGPSGYSDSVCDKVQAMDLGMGSQLHTGMKSKDFNEKLLMGTCIGPVGGIGSGTLGGFVVLQDGQPAAITCAHVAPRQSRVSQPAEAELEDDTSAGRCVFGRVCTSVFDTGSIDKTGVDASAIIITERFPDDARFVWARKEQLKFAGFDPGSPPRFSKGAILRLGDITPSKRHISVLKVGAETGLTKGTLYLDGLYVRTTNREMRLPGKNQMVEFFNQMEVASVQGATIFFNLGDSGALVFMPLNGSELHCFGQCIGCTSYGSCVITPIDDVFKRLNIKSFIDFT